MNEFILTADFGSTFTKLTAVDAVNNEVVGTAKAFTTIETDIRDGFMSALNELQGTTGKLNFQHKLAASSAGGGLKMVALGLVASLTAKAAYTAACSAGAKVVKTYSYEINLKEQEEIFEINPDLILLSGGTDGGNKEVILHNAKKLAEIDRNFSIIIAGNKSVSSDIYEILKKGNKHSVICNNVMPEFGILDVMPAKNAIRDLFMEKIIEAKGLNEISKMMYMPIIPTPLAVFECAALLSQTYGDLLVVDVGGATTDVYTMCSGKPTLPAVVQKGLPEPFDKRTVEGDLGMRYSLDFLVEAAGSEDILKHHELCLSNPSFIPEVNSQNKDYDEKLCGMAIDIAVERHSGVLETVFTPFGESYYQTGKDLSEIRYVIGVGGPIIYSREPKKILENSLFKQDSLCLKPKKPKYLLDNKYIFGAMGLISRINKKLAEKTLLKNISEV